MGEGGGERHCDVTALMFCETGGAVITPQIGLMAGALKNNRL
jgi:hypothetical protein